MNSTLRFNLGALALSLVLAAASVAHAQSAPVRPPSDELLVEVIQTRLKQLQHAQGLDDATRKSLQTIYDDAQKSMLTVKQWTDKTMQFAQMALHAPSLLEQTKAELAAQPAERSLAIPAEATVKELEQAIVNRESELGKLRLDLEKAEAEPKRRTAEREKNTEKVVALR
jgi:predicted nucleotidyltransferase